MVCHFLLILLIEAASLHGVAQFTWDVHILLGDLNKCLEKTYITQDINKGKYDTPPFLINTIYVLSFSQMKDISINYFHNKRFPLSSFKLYEIQKIRLALGVVLFTLIKYKLPNDMNLWFWIFLFFMYLL